MPKKFEKFIGLNNVDEEEALSTRELRVALNVDITDRGFIKRRKGYTQLQSGSFHSLWSEGGVALVVSGDSLYSIDPNMELSLVRSGLALGRTLSYAYVDGNVYYSNGIVTGRVDNGLQDQTWGVEMPNSPVLTAVSGGFEPGSYLVKLTFVDASGVESGASQYAYINLQDGQAVSVGLPTALSQTIEHINVYRTPTNGERYYLAATVPYGTANVVLSSESSAVQLETDGLYPVEPGHVVGEYNGRIYVFNGKALYFTEAMGYNSMRLADNFFLYPVNITDVIIARDGIFVGADKTYFLGGADPAEMEQNTASVSVPVRGTSIVVDGSSVEAIDATEDVPMWVSDYGFMAGLPGGNVVELTRKKVDFPVGPTGTSHVVNSEGISKLITVLKSPAAKANNLGFGDRVTAEVRRNGVVIG